jgi:hypothetical protein
LTWVSRVAIVLNWKFDEEIDAKNTHEHFIRAYIGLSNGQYIHSQRFICSEKFHMPASSSSSLFRSSRLASVVIDFNLKGMGRI